LKNELSAQKNQVLLRFEQDADKIVSELDELLYHADKPNYRTTAQQLQKLNGLKWVDDDYTIMGANRITIMMYDESVVIITQSILQERVFKDRFNRQRFAEAKELFFGKYSQLQFLKNIVKELTTEQNQVQDWLETEIESILKAIHTLCETNECPLGDFHSKLIKLHKLEELCIIIIIICVIVAIPVVKGIIQPHSDFIFQNF
jgi:hypothetical protein